jgi:hypothetical protein
VQRLVDSWLAAPVISLSALRGYVLEELLAWLLQESGYTLLVAESQDPIALCSGPNGLRVRGRGVDHQVDVLGELRQEIPFSLPVRLFLEAKFRTGPVGLPEVRNALGVINDVNEHYSAAIVASAKSYERFHYRYALFSASGFTADAQGFALAQQISLVDLSGPSFRWILDAASATAKDVRSLAAEQHLQSFPVNQLREALRRALRTWTIADDDADGDADSEPDFVAAGRRARRAEGTAGHQLDPERLARIVGRLIELDGALYIALTSTPFMTVLQPDDPGDRDALRDLDAAGELDLAFAGVDTSRGEWVLSSEGRGRRGSTLRFGVPPLHERWILGQGSVTREVGMSPGRPHPRDKLRSVYVLGPQDPVTLKFRMRGDDRRSWVDDVPATDSSSLRRTALDPALVLRHERAPHRAWRAGWPGWAVLDLLHRLRAERYVQAAVIERAAAQGGSIDRATVYEIAGYPSHRTLRGFTTPVKRLTRLMQEESDLPVDLIPALEARYDHGVLATRFEVPDEFVEALSEG